jgi:hypothetical protein
MKQKYIDRFHARYEKKETGCWNWIGGKNYNGYGTYKINTDFWLAHRFSAHIHGLDMSMPIIRHQCNNPSCVNPEHLLPGTVQDNMNDKVNANRQSKGANHGTAKLTETQVLEIRSKYKPRIYTLKMLSQEYNISLEPIRRIIERRTWKHI